MSLFQAARTARRTRKPVSFTHSGRTVTVFPSGATVAQRSVSLTKGHPLRKGI